MAAARSFRRVLAAAVLFGATLLAADDAGSQQSVARPQASTPGLDPGLYWRSTDTLWIYDRTPELGMNSFRLGPGDLTQLAALHSRIVRLTLYVDLYTAGRQTDFGPITDRLCANGFVPLVVVHSGQGYLGTPVGDYARFATLMAQVAAKHPCVRYWQLWNEVDGNPRNSTVFGPDSSSAWAKGVRYAEMLRVTYPAIKAANPSALVMTAGTTRVYDDTSSFIRGVYDGGGRMYFDVLGYHTYGGEAQWDTPPRRLSECESVTGVGIRSRLQCLKILLRDHGDAGRPVWITEFGWAACAYPHYRDRPLTTAALDSMQRAYWSRTVQVADSIGIVQKLIGFTLGATEECGHAATDDAQRGLRPDDHGYGLFRSDGVTPRPTFVFLRDTARYNEHAARYPKVSGAISIRIRGRRPVGIPYTRTGDDVTFTVVVDKLAPTVVVWENEPQGPPSRPDDL